MKTILRCLRVLTVSSCVAILLLIASFFTLQFVFLHLIVPGHSAITIPDDLVVILFSLMLGGALAFWGFVWTTWRFWPKNGMRP